jgi:hypothetical protein
MSLLVAAIVASLVQNGVEGHNDPDPMSALLSQ